VAAFLVYEPISEHKANTRWLKILVKKKVYVKNNSKKIGVYLPCGSVFSS
jgi:hypothetical protein